MSTRVDGKVRNDLTPDAVIKSVHIGQGLGSTSAYTWMKLPVVDEMDRVMESTTLPTLLLGGDPADPDEAFASWEKALGAAVGARADRRPHPALPGRRRRQLRGRDRRLDGEVSMHSKYYIPARSATLPYTVDVTPESAGWTESSLQVVELERRSELDASHRRHRGDDPAAGRRWNRRGRRRDVRTVAARFGFRRPGRHGLHRHRPALHPARRGSVRDLRRPRQASAAEPPGGRRRRARRAARRRQLQPAGAQLRHRRRLRGRLADRLRGDHPRRQLVELPGAQARREHRRRVGARGDLLLRDRLGARRFPRVRLPPGVRHARPSDRGARGGAHRRRRPGAARLPRSVGRGARLPHVLPERDGRAPARNGPGRSSTTPNTPGCAAPGKTRTSTHGCPCDHEERDVVSKATAFKTPDAEPTVRLTVAQATIRFLANQYVERDGERTKFFAGCFGIFGHGNVAGIGQALLQAETRRRPEPDAALRAGPQRAGHGAQRRRLRPAEGPAADVGGDRQHRPRVDQHAHRRGAGHHQPAARAAAARRTPSPPGSAHPVLQELEQPHDRRHHRQRRVQAAVAVLRPGVAARAAAVRAARRDARAHRSRRDRCGHDRAARRTCRPRPSTGRNRCSPNGLGTSRGPLPERVGDRPGRRGDPRRRSGR